MTQAFDASDGLDVVLDSVKSLFLDKGFLTSLRKDIVRKRSRERRKSEPSEAGPLDILDQLDQDRTVFNELKDRISRHLAARFGNSCPILSHDLVEAMYQQLGGREVDDPRWSESYVRSANYVMQLIKPDDSVDIGNLGVFTNDADQEVYGHVIWEWNRNFRLCLWVDEFDSGLAQRLLPSREKIDARLLGCATPAAMDAMKERMVPWVIGIGDVVRMSALSNERVIELGGFPLEDESSVRVQYLCSDECKAVFAACLDAIITIEDQRSSLQKRLINALTLYQQATRHVLPAIGLMLCFSAIEAAVTEKGHVVEQLSSHSTALLTRDLLRRRDAGHAIAGLYDSRSQLAHGGSIDAPERHFLAARKLAAGVIRAVCAWIAHCKKIGDHPVEHKDFITELIVCARNGQEMVEVPELGELLP